MEPRASTSMTDSWTSLDVEIIETLLLDTPCEDTMDGQEPEVKLESGARQHLLSPGSCVDTRVTPLSSWDTTSMKTTVHVVDDDDESSLKDHAVRHATAEEERRARHREVQRRFVQRKKQAINTTRNALDHLKKRYELLQLTSEERQLRRDHERLRIEAAIPRDAPVPTRAQVELLMDDQMNMIQDYFEPLTFDEWTHMLQKNIHEHSAAQHDESFASTGARVMGWVDRRKVADASVQFMLAKSFPNVIASELWTKTWRRLCSQDTHAQFFSPAFLIKMRVLQRIDDNALVLHRALYNPQTGGISHTLETICRLRIGDDYVICGRSLENNAAQTCLDAAHKWLQLCASFSFTPTSQGSAPNCVFQHSGALRNFCATGVKYWFIEMFFMMLRYESAMVAPVFSICPE